MAVGSLAYSLQKKTISGINTISIDLDNYQSNTDSKISNLNNDLKTANTNISNLSSNLSSVKSSVDSLNKVVNLKLYSHPSQLGLSFGCTVMDLVNKLPDYSMGIFYSNGSDAKIENVPGSYYGTLEIIRLTINRVVLRYSYTDGISVYNAYYNKGNTEIKWIKFINANDFSLSTTAYTLNSTYCESGSYLHVFKYGRIVYVKFWIRFTSSLPTGTYTYYTLATGLPKSVTSGECISSAICVDGYGSVGYVSVNTSGNFNINIRELSLTSKTIVGGFTYLCQ